MLQSYASHVSNPDVTSGGWFEMGLKLLASDFATLPKKRLSLAASLHVEIIHQGSRNVSIHIYLSHTTESPNSIPFAKHTRTGEAPPCRSLRFLFRDGDPPEPIAARASSHLASYPVGPAAAPPKAPAPL